MICDLHSLDASAGARGAQQTQCGGVRGLAGHCWDVGAREGQRTGGAGSPCGLRVVGGWQLSSRIWPSGTSMARRSATLAPRCKAAEPVRMCWFHCGRCSRIYAWNAQCHPWWILVAWLESGYWHGLIDSYPYRVICAQFPGFYAAHQCVGACGGYALMRWSFSNLTGIICPILSIMWFRCRTFLIILDCWVLETLVLQHHIAD